MKNNLKVMVIILVIGSLLIFGVSKVKTTSTYTKYKLVVMAALQGAENFSIEDNSVAFSLEDKYVTYYEAGYSYGIRSLSGE